MKKPVLRVAMVLGVSTALVASLAACGSTTPAVDEKVTITVADRPTADKTAERQRYDDSVASFEAANPNITLKTAESVYDVTTFQALVAGGSLPDVMSVPFTEAKALIQNKQVADITSALKTTGVDKQLSPRALSVTQDADGNIFGVPIGAYSIGLVYNRDLFTQAGLDPDKPPTTWDEVRADAKQITDKTGVPGYGQMAAKNTGGWMFTAITYSYGGRIENEDGSKVAFNDSPSADALQTLKEMRWTDGSIGADALYDYDSVTQAFAAGKFGMFVGGPDMYWGAVINDKMDKSLYGVGGMPQADGVNGTLTGGTIEIVSPDATEAEKAAAAKWISWFYLRQFEDKDTAIQVATDAAAAGSPVGLPGLSVVSNATNDQYLEWIKDQINVPQENFAPYVTASDDIPIVPEPVNKAQEVYAALDAVVQAVLTDPNANISDLLASAETTVNAKLAR